MAMKNVITISAGTTFLGMRKLRRSPCKKTLSLHERFFLHMEYESYLKRGAK